MEGTSDEKVPLNAVSWRVSSWSPSNDLFQLEGKTVTILQPGNYFVYAQVTFYSLHSSVNLFYININNEPFVTCRASLLVDPAACLGLTGAENKDCSARKSCYAGKARPLQAGDKIKITPGPDRALQTRDKSKITPEDLKKGGKVIIGAADTYFGIVKF